MCKGVSYVLHNVSLPFRFLHFGVHLAVSPCLFVSLSLCFADNTLLWQVSLRFLSLRSVLSVSLLISVCLPLSLVSLQFDITVLTLCRSASPCLSVCPFLCLSLCLLLAWCFSDATEVVWTAITLFLYLYWLSFSPLLMFFPSEWCWKWKSCTSRHSRGWTSCTCEHKTSGNAVTSRLLLSVLLFSADIPQILKKSLRESLQQGTSGIFKGLSGGKIFIFYFFYINGSLCRNVPEYIWQQTSHKLTVFRPTVVKTRMFMPLVVFWAEKQH